MLRTLFYIDLFIMFMLIVSYDGTHIARDNQKHEKKFQENAKIIAANEGEPQNSSPCPLCQCHIWTV